MNFEENNMQEAFDRYITGQMSEGEKTVFLEELERDPALKAAFDNYINLVAGIRAARRDELKDYIKRNAKIRYMGNVWSRSWVIASAAIVTIFLGAYLVLSNYSSNKPAEQTVMTNTPQRADSAQEEMQDIIIEQDQVAHNESENNAKDDTTPGGNEGVAGKPEKSIPYYVLEKPDINLDPTRVADKKITSTKSLDISYETGDSYMYKYNKTSLVLYKVPAADKKSVYEYNRSAYLSWNKSYYLLKSDGKARALEAVKDSAVLKTLPPVK